MSLKPVKLNFTRSKNSNRQIKILGRTHRRELKQTTPNNKNRKVIIREWNNRIEFNNGNLDVLRGLTRRKVDFTNSEIENLFRTIGNKKMIVQVKFNDGTVRNFSLTPNSRDSIKLFLTNYADVQQLDTFGSGKLDEIDISTIKDIRLIEMTEGFTNKDGGYFQYINTTLIDLTKYQIYYEVDNRSDDENCLIHTLRQYGVEEDKLNNIKLAFVSGVQIPRCKLINICDMLKTSINLHHFRDDDDKTRMVKYGKYDESVDIAVYQNHFFKLEETIYNEFAIKNYEQCETKEQFHDIYRFKRDRPQYKKTKKINTLQLIHLLFKQGMFEDDNSVLFTNPNQPELKDPSKIIINNDILDNDQKLFEKKEPQTVPTDFFFADMETIVTEGNHKLLLGGITQENNDETAIFEGKDNIVHKMLNFAIYKAKGDFPAIYFHNLKYDFNVMKEYLDIKSICQRGGAIYFVDVYKFKKVAGKWVRKVIRLKDSYKLINSPLRDFPKVFGLPKEMQKQEAIGYTYYDSITSTEERAYIKDYIKHIKKNEKKILLKVLEENQKLFSVDFESKTFNHMAYYKHYLKYDCEVLKAGLVVFREKIKAIANIDVHLQNTISGLSFEYFHKKGAFDDIMATGGNFREYLSRTIKGGRVSTLKKQTKKIINKKLVDYDACSLYPSAIHRICEELGGFPKGLAQKIETKNKNELDKFDYYVVTIRINKINKKQQIPFISMKDEDGLLQYINKVPEGGLIDVIDKITLDDYIKHHDIDYEILDGVYYNEGFNDTFGNEILDLYNKRKVEKKKAKNGKTDDEKKSGSVMQNIIKLMLNSAYGKTILKKSKTKEIIKEKGEKTEKYICSNFNTIIEYQDINSKQTLIKMNGVDESNNLSIIGLIILSMSKRIMNEVMGLANDLKIPVYYQDTDSMHIEKEKIKQLEDAFEVKYNRVLNGGDLGNFHSDFDLDGADSEIYSTESIFLGKKCYIDKLECINKDGSKVEGYHVRLKGVTKAGLDDQIEKHGDAMKLFKKLSTGEKVKFTLNPTGKCSFEYNNLGVITRPENSFIREICF